MKPFYAGYVACLLPLVATVANAQYTAAVPEPTAVANSTPMAEKAGPRTGLYGTVMKGNAAADNTIDDLTKRPHLIDQQYLAGWGGADLGSAGYSFEAAGFNWFGAAYGGAAPDEIRLGLAKQGQFGGGLILSLAKFSTEDSVAGGTAKTKTVLESDGFGAFGSFMLGAAGDVYGEVSVYTGFDDLAADNNNYSKVEVTGAPTAEVTPRVIHLLAGWKRDASTEGTHSLNAEFILNIDNLKNDNGTTSVERKLTDVQLLFYHGYIMKDAGSFKVFAGSNSEFRYRSFTLEAAPSDSSTMRLQVTPNMSFQKTLGKGFEAYSGVGVNLAYISQTNTLQGTTNFDKFSSFITVGTDMALGLRWTYENLAVEGALKESVLANGPQFIGGTANQGLFGQLGVSVGF